jgi:hypothetical protein
MMLLAVLIITPSILVLLITVRCTVWLEPACWDRPWPVLFRDWLAETIPVLVAIIMSGRSRPPP